MLTSTDFRGLFNRRFFNNFFPLPASSPLIVGLKTPNFELPDATNDQQVKLNDYREQKPVILAFTRIFTEKQYCPLCYPHIVELNKRYEEFRQRNIEVLMITSTDVSQSQQVVKDLGIQFPLLSNPTCSVFRKYGVGQALGAPLPGQFVLDEEGVLRYKHLFSFLSPNASVDELLSVFSPQETVATAANG
ncbi:MAG: alkyl hydroperoxide reductase [Cyanobacteria bacterium SW_9_44_58]|nr:MAG: alkyl hydroperoxide reductase [Cyanobacteria bacterium SW_9_44_58]